MENRSVSKLKMPSLARNYVEDASPTCTVSRGITSDCGAPVPEGMPYSVCAKHAIKIFRYMQGMVDAAPASAKESARSHRAIPDKAPRRGVRDVVYYIEVDGLIKIGFSSDFARRLRQYPPSAKVLAVEDGGKDRERQMLTRFAYLRVARQEWHRKDSALMDHIKQIADKQAA